jgi:hypothetical protein
VHDKRVICLREAACSLHSHCGEEGQAKAGNTAGGFFQHSLKKKQDICFGFEMFPLLVSMS